MFKWVVLAILVFSLGFGGFIGYEYLRPSPNKTPETTLEMSTNNLAPQIGQDFDIALNINTQENIVYQALISLDFDQTKAKYISVEAQDGFILDSSSIQTDNGLEFRVRSANLTGFSGTKTLARIKLNAIARGTLTIIYGKRTIVGAASEFGENVLSHTTPIAVEIR